MYSVTNIWDPQIKKIKKEQLYLGFFENGKLTLTESRIEVAEPLLIGSIYEESFFQWQREQGIKKLIEQEQEGAIDLSIFDVGNYLVLSKVADDLGMTKFLASHFEDVIATDILSLAFYCVADEYCPLYQIVDWSADQYLSSEKTFTEGRIV